MSKNIDYYMNLHYPFLVAGNNKEGYVASAIDLTGCLTYGDTMEELMENIQDAKGHGWKRQWRWEWKFLNRQDFENKRK